MAGTNGRKAVNAKVVTHTTAARIEVRKTYKLYIGCLLYTSDAADE